MSISQKYELAVNHFTEDEIKAAKAVLDSGYMTMGRLVKQFESEFAAYLGVKHAVMVNSGSSANLIAVETLLRPSNGEPILRSGDKVIVPALAWPTTVWPLVQLGLTPVFVDVDPNTLAISLDRAETACTKDPSIKGMFLINVLGIPPHMSRYVNFCKERGLILLEDNCESLGAKSGGQFLGTFGKISSFSMYFSHHISTIEGGVVVTNDDAIADDLRSSRAHGWTRERQDKDAWSLKYPNIDQRFLFITQGYNVRPTEIQAAIGLTQLQKLNDYSTSRNDLVSKVAEKIETHAPFLKVISTGSVNFQPDAQYSWMTIPLYVSPDSGLKALDVIEYFEKNCVECRPIIAGNLTRHPACRNMKMEIAGSLEVCDSLLEYGFMIGCHPTLSEENKSILYRAIEGLEALA